MRGDAVLPREKRAMLFVVDILRYTTDDYYLQHLLVKMCKINKSRDV